MACRHKKIFLIEIFVDIFVFYSANRNMNRLKIISINFFYCICKGQVCRHVRVYVKSAVLAALSCAFLFSGCQNPIKPMGTMTGKEAREYVRKKLLPVTLIDASLASSSNITDKIDGTYELTFDVLIPSMLKVDDNAYYSESKVKACAEQIFKTSFQLTSSLAVFQCSLKPVPALYFGDL